MSCTQIPRSVLQHGISALSIMSKRLSTCPPYSKEVFQDEKKKQFYLNIDDDRAYIQYKKLNGAIDLFHTQVPEKCQGHGVGGALAKGTFELIKEKKLRIKLTCEYLQSYYKKNKTDELTGLLIEEQRHTL